jgi:hypothetical protein
MVSDMLFFEKSSNEIKKKGSRKIQLEIRQKLNTITPSMFRRISFAETWQIVNFSNGPRDYGKNHYGFIESMSEEVRLSQCSAGAKVFKTDFEDHQNELMHLLFSKFNKTVFNNRLEHRIVFNRRLTSCYGQCDRFEDSGRRMPG